MKFVGICVLIGFIFHGKFCQDTNASDNSILTKINSWINATCDNATLIQNLLNTINNPNDKIDAENVITKFMNYQLFNLGHSNFFSNQSVIEKINSNKEDITLLLKIAGFLNAHGLKTIDAGFICRGFNKTYPLLTAFSNENIKMVQSGFLTTIKKYQANVQVVVNRFYEDNKKLIDKLIKNQPTFIEDSLKYSGFVRT